MPTLDDEVAFISGLNANGSLASVSYGDWTGSNPATYNPGAAVSVKWFGGSNDVAGTSGGTVDYYFDPASNWLPWEAQVFIDGLSLWSAVANISFQQVSDPALAQITLHRGNDSAAYTTGAFQSSSSNLTQITSATISIDTTVPGFGPLNNSFIPYAGYPWNTVLHEEGHALGLGHGGPYNGSVNPATAQYSPYDTTQYTIMSYVDPADPSAAYRNQYPLPTSWGTSVWNGQTYDNVPQTLMPLDILAVQRKYGVQTSGPLSGGQVFGFNTNITGNLTPFYDFTSNTKPILTLWDSGAHNTLDLSGFSLNSIVNLNAGAYSSVNGMINNIAIALNTKIDTLITGAGNDFITGNNDGNIITPGAGTNTVTGGTGDDIFIGGPGNNTINGGLGQDTLWLSGSSSQYSYYTDNTGHFVLSRNGETEAIEHVEALYFANGLFAVPPSAWTIFDAAALSPTGGPVDASGVGNTIYIGGKENDTFHIGGQSTIIYAGGGTNVVDAGNFFGNTVVFTHSLSNYIVTASPTPGGLIFSLPDGESTTVSGNVQLAFNVDPSIVRNLPSTNGPGKNPFLMLGHTADPFFAGRLGFNPLEYIATYPDLMKAIGGFNDYVLGRDHYQKYGFAEGRTPNFSGMNYVASYSDLINALGENTSAAIEHYIKYGYAEGRKITFDPLAYTASYADLMNGFGVAKDDPIMGAMHYIDAGYHEGRTITFDPLQYIASYSDLIVGLGDDKTAAEYQYIDYGFREGRHATFDALKYVASYSDLLKGIGANPVNAYEHYIKYGYAEGRTQGNFDVINYLATYSDLINGIGDNPAAGYQHYIKYGFTEGRTASFDSVAYLFSYSDLQNAGLSLQNAAKHYLDYGFKEGRSAAGAFGTDQAQHILPTAGGNIPDTLTANDRDWFSVDLKGGQTYELGIFGSFGTLADPFLQVRDASGALLRQTATTINHNAIINFTPTASGTYYLIASSNIPGASGSYAAIAAPYSV